MNVGLENFGEMPLIERLRLLDESGTTTGLSSEHLGMPRPPDLPSLR